MKAHKIELIINASLTNLIIYCHFDVLLCNRILIMKCTNCLKCVENLNLRAKMEKDRKYLTFHNSDNYKILIYNYL